LGVKILKHRIFDWIAVLLCGAAFAHAETSDLRKAAQTVYAGLERQLSDTSMSVLDRARAALRISKLADHPELLTELGKHDAVTAQALSAEDLLRQYRFGDASGLVAALAGNRNPDARALHYHWLFLSEDLRTADSLTRTELAADTADVAAGLARGELLYRLLKYDDATSTLERALRHASTPTERAQASVVLAKIYEKQNRYQQAFDSLATLLTPQTLTAEILYQTGLILIDLSRVSEAIDLFEEATRWNPDYELAHYFLGNGYARLNYTQLREKYPRQYGDPNALKALASAETAFADGNMTAAKNMTRALLTTYPEAVEPPAFLGSLAWDEAEADSAEFYFREALVRCPEYGRAQNGLAKSLELKRMRINVHRGEDSLKFAREQMPIVPQIDQFVANWKSLSPRHQKQVALAMAPWKLYLPVLVESGHRYYIKPLHERLSQSPGLETLKDQRISYDSRLWDDVRGCGGYTTVTGIEDVERSIYSGYNTVLHELTHQVHGVFPPADAEKLLNVFHTARNREDAGEKVFMSQYQASSAWEYFAEGANGYYSPRRDEYDTREIVHERLFASDTTLAHLVEYYVQAPNLEACYPVGLVDAAQDATERNQLAQAMSYAQKAYARAPRGEVVLAELSHLYSLRDDDQKALAFADSLRTFYPQKAGGYTQWQGARFFTDGNLDAGIARLQDGLAVVDTSEEREAVRQALGNALSDNGDYVGAEQQYRAVLLRHNSDSDALWGLAGALGDDGKFSEADSVFQKALLERSGIADLRLDYARMLLHAGRLTDAETQINEAAILTPGEPPVLTMQGWLASCKGEWKMALELYDQSLALAPYDRLPAVLRLEALRHTGQSGKAEKEWKRLERASRTDTPQWFYNERQSVFLAGYTWPHYLRHLLETSRATVKT
jgi:tetratricopeptide (TPR) repeat protein